MQSTQNGKCYDEFSGPELDISRWRFLEFPLPGDETYLCAEPGARTTLGDGALTVSVGRFQNQHPVQGLDNCKHVLLSTEVFRLPESGRMTVSAQLAATNHAATSRDYRDGFVTLNVVEMVSGLVFDAAVTGDAVFAIHERLPGTDEVPIFTRVVDDPFAGLVTGPGVPHNCAITFDTRSGTVQWHADGALLYEVSGTAIPAEINVGLGMFTLHPVTAGASRSLHGQGLTGSWRDVRVDYA